MKENTQQSRKMRVIALSDLHCGHQAGLTPPRWMMPKSTEVGKLQRELWRNYSRWLKEYANPDVLLVLGDCIDGKGERSGGTEQVYADRLTQTDIAVECLEPWKAGKTCMVYGTPYHTGQYEDYEREIAKALNAEIHGQMFVECKGVTFHIKHKVGASGIPHGRHTATARDRMWLQIMEEELGWEKADVVLRGHVHYHQYAGGPDWLGMTLPSLCSNTKYGSRQCMGTVHFGIVIFEIDDAGYDWKSEVVQIKEARPTVVKV